MLNLKLPKLTFGKSTKKQDESEQLLDLKPTVDQTKLDQTRRRSHARTLDTQDARSEREILSKIDTVIAQSEKSPIPILDTDIPFNDSINRSVNFEPSTDLPNTYIVGDGKEFPYFDNLIHILADGDTVQFEQGTHVILTSQIPVSNLKLVGVNTSDTLVDVVSDAQGPLFCLEDKGSLTIENLTLRFAPNMQLVTYGQDASINLQNCNVHWNHYKIKTIMSNTPLIIPTHPDNILQDFTAVETYITTVKLAALHITLKNSGIGDDNGETGHLLGWAEDWENANFHNMNLSVVGAAKELTALGKVVISDITGDLLSRMPNLANAPFVIEHLLFGRVANHASPDSLLFAPGSIQDRISRFSRAFVNDQATAIKLRKRYWESKNLSPIEQLMATYEVVNTKSHGALYIDFDTDSLTTDRRAIYNNGNLVVSGNTYESTSDWACVQGGGQLIFNHLITKWMWTFESEEAREKSRFKTLDSTWGDTEKNLIKLTPTTLRPRADLSVKPIPIMQQNVRTFFESNKPFWENAVQTLDFEPSTVYIISKPIAVTTDRFVTAMRKARKDVTYLSEKTVTESSPREHIALLAARVDRTWLVTLNALTEGDKWKKSLLAFVASQDIKLKLVVIADTPAAAEDFSKQIVDPLITIKTLTL